MKAKNHDHLNRCRKSIWQNSTSIYDNGGIEGIYQNIIKAIYERLHHTQEWKAFSSKVKIKTRTPTLSIFFKIILEVLARVIKQEKEIKVIQIGKEKVKLSLFADNRTLYIILHQKTARKN